MAFSEEMQLGTNAHLGLVLTFCGKIFHKTGYKFWQLFYTWLNV